MSILDFTTYFELQTLLAVHDKSGARYIKLSISFHVPERGVFGASHVYVLSE
jgi:hypothetical protein